MGCEKLTGMIKAVRYLGCSLVSQWSHVITRERSWVIRHFDTESFRSLRLLLVLSSAPFHPILLIRYFPVNFFSPVVVPLFLSFFTFSNDIGVLSKIKCNLHSILNPDDPE